MELLSNQTGNWNIYREISKENLEAFIVRIPKIFPDLKIDSFLRNHTVLKMLGLPTLNIVEKFECNYGDTIRTEDLNYGKEYIYVTPNSLHSDSRKIVESLNPYIITYETKKSSEYEEYRYRNKLKEITNFQDFICKTKEDLMHAANHNLLIDFDAYFFGSKKKAEISLIDYKIVDLDNIILNAKDKPKDCYEYNVKEFIGALHGFVKYFVKKESQLSYSKHLSY